MLQTRIGDIAFGICFWPPPPAGPGPLPSTGIVVSGFGNMLSSGLPASSMGDIVMFPCGTSLIMGGLPTKLNPMPASTLGAPVLGPLVQAMIVSGDPMSLNL